MSFHELQFNFLQKVSLFQLLHTMERAIFKCFYSFFSLWIGGYFFPLLSSFLLFLFWRQFRLFLYFFSLKLTLTGTWICIEFGPVEKQVNARTTSTPPVWISNWLFSFVNQNREITKSNGQLMTIEANFKLSDFSKVVLSTVMPVEQTGTIWWKSKTIVYMKKDLRTCSPSFSSEWRENKWKSETVTLNEGRKLGQ